MNTEHTNDTQPIDPGLPESQPPVARHHASNDEWPEPEEDLEAEDDLDEAHAPDQEEEEPATLTEATSASVDLARCLASVASGGSEVEESGSSFSGQFAAMLDATESLQPTLLNSAMVAAAAVFDFHGFDIDPSTLRAWLEEGGEPSANLVPWARIFAAVQWDGEALEDEDTVTPSLIEMVRIDETTEEEAHELLHDRLEQGYPSIVEFTKDGARFFGVIYARDADGDLIAETAEAERGREFLTSQTVNIDDDDDYQLVTAIIHQVAESYAATI